MACDPTAAFVGESNGKPICCSTMTKYGDGYAFGGSHIVSKEFRGKGDGKKVYDAGLASVKHFPSIAVVSGLKMEKINNKSNGFRSLFYGAYFIFNVPTAITCFSETSITLSGVKIKRIVLKMFRLYPPFKRERSFFLAASLVLNTCVINLFFNELTYDYRALFF